MLYKGKSSWMTGTGTQSQPTLKVRKMRGALRLHWKHVMNSEQALNEKQTCADTSNSFCSSSVWWVKKKSRRISTFMTFYCDLFDINSMPDWHPEDIQQSNCNSVADCRPLLCKNTCSWATFIWEEQEKARPRWTFRQEKRCYPEDFFYFKADVCADLPKHTCLVLKKNKKKQFWHGGACSTKFLCICMSTCVCACTCVSLHVYMVHTVQHL